MQPFVRPIREIPKQVASTTRESVEWNAELHAGDAHEARSASEVPPSPPTPSATASYLLADLPYSLDLNPTARHELVSGAVATMYRHRA